MRSDIQIQIKYSKVFKAILISALIFFAFSAFSFGILLSGRRASDWLTAFMTFYLAIATIVLAIITAIVIVWQGQQLKRQLELQVITELYKEWNDEEMFKARCTLCSILPSDGVISNFEGDTLDKVENVIEFLERIASYYMNGVLTRGLVWDTFSFYIMRYCFYTKNAIKEIEKKWGDDETLYRDLKYLYKDLMKEEENQRGRKEEEIKKCFISEIDKFKKAECYGI